jgi:hypothetical protein
MLQRDSVLSFLQDVEIKARKTLSLTHFCLTSDGYYSKSDGVDLHSSWLSW